MEVEEKPLENYDTKVENNANSENNVLLPSQIVNLDINIDEDDSNANEDGNEIDDGGEEEEPEPEGIYQDHPRIPKDYFLLYIQPCIAPPSEWAMSDPWPVWIPTSYNQFDIALLIERLRGIPAHRQAFRFKDGETLPVKQEKWTMKRLGIRDDYVLKVEPTLPDSWLWYQKEYYVKKFVENLKVIIRENNGFVKLADAIIKVPLPPIFHTSARVVLRQYPELLHVHVDTTYNEAWIMEKKFDRQIPSFSSMPVSLGYTPRIQLPDFSWSDYKDIDDVKPLKLDFPIPDVFFKCIIQKATGLKVADTYENSSNTYAVFYFNDKQIGRTSYKLLNLNPIWSDAIFDIVCSTEIETKNCVIYIEFFHKSLIQDIEDIFLGCLKLTGQLIEDLIGSGNSAIMELPLTARLIENGNSSNDEKESEISGTVTLCGGRKGMELNVYGARQLTPILNHDSHPFAIVFFNGVELLQTLPNRNHRHPVWNEVLCIPDISSSQTLQDVKLEIQIWNTSTAKGAEFGTKEDFMGTGIVTGENLFKLFDKKNVYARSMTIPLTQSKTVPFKQRTKPVKGFVNIIAGPVGLPIESGKKIELTIVQAKGIAKVKEYFFVVLWNYIQVFRSGNLTVDTLHYKDENKKDREVTISKMNQKVILQTVEGARNCLNHSLLIEFYEFDSKEDAGNYLGNVTLQDNDLSAFFDGVVLKENNFELGRDKSWDDKFQRLVRGEVTLRAGPIDARYENQRLIIIESCNNLFGVKPTGESSPFVTITWNKVEVAKTITIHNDINPKWKDQLFCLTCPDTPDKKNPHYNGSSSGCTLHLEVWDEVMGLIGGPKKGTYLGGVYLELDAVGALFENKETTEYEFKLQVGPPGSRGIPKPVRGGKVGPDAIIKITCLGLKYPSWAAVLEEREMLFNGKEVIEDVIPQFEEVITAVEGSVDGSLVVDNISDDTNDDTDDVAAAESEVNDGNAGDNADGNEH